MVVAHDAKRRVAINGGLREGESLKDATDRLNATEPRCPYCGRYASEIPDVVSMAAEEDMTPGQFARYDGTYNRETNHFACNECYIRMGAPSSPSGWRAR